MTFLSNSRNSGVHTQVPIRVPVFSHHLKFPYPQLPNQKHYRKWHQEAKGITQNYVERNQIVAIGESCSLSVFLRLSPNKGGDDLGGILVSLTKALRLGGLIYSDSTVRAVTMDVTPYSEHGGAFSECEVFLESMRLKDPDGQ